MVRNCKFHARWKWTEFLWNRRFSKKKNWKFFFWALFIESGPFSLFANGKLNLNKPAKGYWLLHPTRWWIHRWQFRRRGPMGEIWFRRMKRERCRPTPAEVTVWSNGICLYGLQSMPKMTQRREAVNRCCCWRFRATKKLRCCCCCCGCSARRLAL